MLIQNFTFKAKFREGKEVTPGITWFTEVCLRVYPVVCSSVCEPNLPCGEIGWGWEVMEDEADGAVPRDHRRVDGI